VRIRNGVSASNFVSIEHDLVPISHPNASRRVPRSLSSRPPDRRSGNPVRGPVSWSEVGCGYRRNGCQ